MNVIGTHILLQFINYIVNLFYIDILDLMSQTELIKKLLNSLGKIAVSLLLLTSFLIYFQSTYSFIFIF